VPVAHAVDLLTLLAHQAIAMLLGSYVTAAVLAFRSPTVFNTPLMAGGHIALAAALVVHVRTLKLTLQ